MAREGRREAEGYGVDSGNGLAAAAGVGAQLISLKEPMNSQHTSNPLSFYFTPRPLMLHVRPWPVLRNSPAVRLSTSPPGGSFVAFVGHQV